MRRCPALKELIVWRESKKQKAVTRGHASAGVRIPMHRVSYGAQR